MDVTIPALPQVGKCGYDTAAEVLVTGKISFSCRPVQLNWLEVRAVGWHQEDLAIRILNSLLHLAVKEFGLVSLQPNGGGDLELFD